MKYRVLIPISKYGTGSYEVFFEKIKNLGAIINDPWIESDDENFEEQFNKIAKEQDVIIRVVKDESEEALDNIKIVNSDGLDEDLDDL